MEGGEERAGLLAGLREEAKRAGGEEGGRELRHAPPGEEGEAVGLAVRQQLEDEAPDLGFDVPQLCQRVLLIGHAGQTCSGDSQLITICISCCRGPSLENQSYMGDSSD